MKANEIFEQITMHLIERQQTITAMESATSGYLASLITDTPGASAVFPGSFVTYSNEAKIRCGVPRETVEDFGVYSRETAEAMAAAAQKFYGTDYAIGVTGTFGNVDPNNSDSEPGVVYFAIASGSQMQVCCEHLSAETRHEFKEKTALIVGERLISFLDGDRRCLF